MRFSDIREPYCIDIRAGTSDTLRFRTAKWRTRSGYVFCAALKVPDGVNVLISNASGQPFIEQMQAECLANGVFAPRPYQLGQPGDSAAPSCVFALLENYCQAIGIDATDLILATYPGWEKRANWTEVRWAAIRDDATWQGVHIPTSWASPDTLVGLLVSLQQIGRDGLVDALVRAIPTPNSQR